MKFLSYVSIKGSLVAMILMGLATLLYALRPQQGSIAVVDLALENLPYKIGDWEGRDASEMTPAIRDVLQLDRYVKRFYVNSKGERVFLYIGFWLKQSGDHQAAKHSPQLCLPSNGWTIWGKEKTNIPILGGLSVDSNILFGAFQNTKSVFYYWFFSGERLYTEDWASLIYLALDHLFNGRSDGGIVEVQADLNDLKGTAISQERSKAIAEAFIKDLFPALESLRDSSI